MTDSAMADMLFNMGERAISNSDIEGLKTAVRELLRLLPKTLQPDTPFGSWVTKA